MISAGTKTWLSEKMPPGFSDPAIVVWSTVLPADIIPFCFRKWNNSCQFLSLDLTSNFYKKQEHRFQSRITSVLTQLYNFLCGLKKIIIFLSLAPSTKKWEGKKQIIRCYEAWVSVICDWNSRRHIANTMWTFTIILLSLLSLLNMENKRQAKITHQ